MLQVVLSSLLGKCLFQCLLCLAGRRRLRDIRLVEQSSTRAKGLSFLRITGLSTNIGFPAYEGFIEYNVGTKVFLYTNPAHTEADLLCELSGNTYDQATIMDISIVIDPISGLFGDIVRFGIVQGNLEIHQNLTAQNEVDDLGANACRAIMMLSESPEFTYSFTELYLWNNFHLSRAPAWDCLSLPCCGVLGTCCEYGPCS